MEFNIKSGSPEKQKTACLILGIFENRKLSQAAQSVDEASSGLINQFIKKGDMDGKLGQSAILHEVKGTSCDRVLLIGCGKERELDERNYRKIINAAAGALQNTGASEAVSYLAELAVKGHDLYWCLRQHVEITRNSQYRFEQLKSEKDDSFRPIRKITLNIPNRGQQLEAEQAVREGMAIAEGMRLSRDLGNLPGNICTPSYLAEQAEKMAKQYTGFDIQVLDEARMAELNMGALLSVTRGSRQEAKLIIMQYQGGNKDDKPIVLVGKGITFDSGGISLKPGAAMDEMKYDMCGAASVFGTLTAVAELQLPINVVGIVPASENLPDGDASKPGDIVTSMSGQTIEILNTDAEGRLVLCDALTYAGRFEPDSVIDIATLTGACVIALGKHNTGLMSNHSPLAHELLNAGKKASDPAWELPIGEDYNEQLKSNFADMANIGGREGGAITAACFLSRFTKKYHWAHLDIAGTAWISGEKKGATGRPVPLLTQYILNQVEKKQK
jgi:leucyl aminopeptidase